MSPRMEYRMNVTWQAGSEMLCSSSTTADTQQHVFGQAGSAPTNAHNTQHCPPAVFYPSTTPQNQGTICIPVPQHCSTPEEPNPLPF